MKQLTMPTAARRPTPEPYAATLARRDALVDSILRKPCDPRGAFINRGPIVSETDWPAYRDAYHARFDELCKGAA